MQSSTNKDVSGHGEQEAADLLSALRNCSSKLGGEVRVQGGGIVGALIGLDLLLHGELQPELVYARHILLPGVDIETIVEEVCWVSPWHPPGGLHYPTMQCTVT